MDSNRSRGASVIELVVAMAIFSVLSVIIFSLFKKGTTAVIVSNAQHNAQLSLNKAHTWLKRDIEQTSPKHIQRMRVPLAGNGDAVWFLSADEPGKTDPNTRYVRSRETGKPIYQTVILYYLIRPMDYSQVSSGYPAAIDPNPVADFYAPHKFLIRKVIDLQTDPTIPEVLPSPSVMADYMTQPQDYSLQPFPSEGAVVDYRLIADQMLSFQVQIHPTVIEVSTAALRIEEARKKASIGHRSFQNSPFVEYRQARFQLRN